MRKRKLPSSAFTMAYWRSGTFWLGKVLERPEVMTQGRTLKDLEENLRDAYRMIVLDEVPADYKTKRLAL